MHSGHQHRGPLGYGAQQYPDWYGDPYYDDYEEPRESTIFKLFREASNYLTNRKKNKKKRHSSSDSSDDDRRRRTGRNKQQQQYQSAGLMNVAQPALVTHYPVSGPPIQSIAYVMTTVPVAAAQPPPPVAQPSFPTPPRLSPELNSVSTFPTLPRPSPELNPVSTFPTDRRLAGYLPRQQGPIYQNDDPSYADMATSQLFPQPFNQTSEAGNTFSPDEENLLQTLLQARIAQLPNRMQNPIQSAPDLLADRQGLRDTSLPSLSGTGAAIANLQRLSQQMTPTRPPSILGNSSPSGTGRLPPPVRQTSNIGITNLEWLNEPRRILPAEERRPITVWPDRSIQDSNIVRLQIDSKLYIGNNIVERLQEITSPRSRLDSTPVSRMIVLLLERDDVRPEDYQLVGEDDVIMKWTALMGDYNLRDGARIRLRRRTKPGRVVRRQRGATEPSRITRNQGPNAETNPRIASLPALPVEAPRTFSNLGSIMY